MLTKLKGVFSSQKQLPAACGRGITSRWGSVQINRLTATSLFYSVLGPARPGDGAAACAIVHVFSNLSYL